MLENSVRVDDYFGNDDNGLWAWYLCNLRRGNFEELNGNELKAALLRRFLNEQLMPETVPFNKKLLLVSIPDDIHENTNLLENFLRDYFHLDDLQYIQIRKLTQEQCYNHENHYLISDNLSNFNDKSFLEFAARSRSIRSPAFSRPESTGNEYSIISGETGFDCVRSSIEPQEISAEPGSSKITSKDSDSVITPSTRPVTVENSESLSSSGDEQEEDSGELVLQFKCHRVHEKSNQGPDLRKPFGRDQDPSACSSGTSFDSEDGSSYNSELLTQTFTIEDNSASPTAPGDVSELSSVDHSLRSLSYDSDYSNGSSSMTSIFPSLSISEKFGRFRLVLQSILIQQPDTRQLFTAVRQSNNDPNVAHVKDDWLLYDDKFSMDNLQMLALHDVLEMNKFFPKVLFYTLVMIDEDVAPDAQTYRPARPVVSPKPTASISTLSDHSLKPETTLTLLTQMNSQVSSAAAYNAHLPAVHGPRSRDGYHTTLKDANGGYRNENASEYEDRSDDDEQENYINGDGGDIVQLFAASRSNSNKSVAHRSIRTIKSIGDWAFHHDSAARTLEFSSPSVSDLGTERALMKTKSKSSVKSGLTKSMTIGSLSTVERSKSVPVPSILKTLSSLDDEALYLKRKVAKFKRKRMAKHKKSEPKCALM
ncbi:LADA_0G13454g1_1 [Lachancea dasiensis]|uniref:LADA_0G13454g1_1 n=1 Tax=Lachancea dasiensis TaxID=1072105 RepID=A0A1G4JVT8_9SACH|nr:LADA_0G13454g1_1 [Lachancea dasiensis]